MIWVATASYISRSASSFFCRSASRLALSASLSALSCSSRSATISLMISWASSGVLPTVRSAAIEATASSDFLTARACAWVKCSLVPSGATDVRVSITAPWVTRACAAEREIPNFSSIYSFQVLYPRARCAFRLCAVYRSDQRAPVVWLIASVILLASSTVKVSSSASIFTGAGVLVPGSTISTSVLMFSYLIYLWVLFYAIATGNSASSGTRVKGVSSMGASGIFRCLCCFL